MAYEPAPGSPASAEEEIVFDILGSARSMRWLTNDPVEPELLERLVWAATRASNGNNAQAWGFVVVTDPELKLRIQQAIVASPDVKALAAQPPPEDPVVRRTVAGSMNLFDTMHEAPALIFIAGTNLVPGNPDVAWDSAVHAAAQNLLIAARAMGLGASFTTFHRLAEDEIKGMLNIPENYFIGVTVPVGWPGRAFGPVNRNPISQALHWNTW